MNFMSVQRTSMTDTVGWINVYLTARCDKRGYCPLIELVHRLQVPCASLSMLRLKELPVMNEHCVVLSHNLLHHIQARICYHLNHMSVLAASHPHTPTLNMM
jgi:hypothetical protein